IVILTFIVAILLTIIMVSRIRKTLKIRKINKYLKEFEDVLTEFIFEEDVYEVGSDPYTGLLNQLRGVQRSSWKREAFVKVVMRLHRDFKGLPAKRLELLYKDLSLETFAQRKFRYSSWYEKAAVLAELGQMQIENSLPFAVEYIDHYNKILREEAQFAAIKMGGVQNMQFLVKVRRPISHWQQTRIMQELDNFPLDQIPSFYYLLDARNPTVKVFALKLIAKYRQLDQPELLVELLSDPRENIRLTALQTLVEIDYYEGVDRITAKTKEQPKEHWPQFLAAVGKLGSPDHIEWLSEFLVYSDYTVVMSALRSMIQLGFILSPSSKQPEFVKELYKHARYELIR
ncbi:MAG TPA: hypothetical protein VFV37_04350, partial [Luteibaculaceae bacterium]|nr:hypothetical protein [Luteibaculaceae bacterium]